MRAICLMIALLSLLGGCAASQRPEPEQHPYRDVNLVIQAVYGSFPELPVSHVFVTYDHMLLAGRRELYVNKLRIYVPRAELEQSEFRSRLSGRARELFQRLGSPNPECAMAVAGQDDIFFDGIAAPLREVELEIACG